MASVWPSGHHAPGVQHHLRPLRSSSATDLGRSSLEALEARNEVIYAARSLENMVQGGQKPIDLLERMWMPQPSRAGSGVSVKQLPV